MDNKPKFNNTQNEHIVFRHITNQGSYKVDAWISRSVAVVGIVFILVENTMKVLIAKRSKNMLDEAGKYGIPCGYLDWGETAFEAMTREVYEETSLYLPEYKDYLIYNNKEQPIMFRDNPTNNRQNVSLIYLSVFDLNKSPDLFPDHILNYSNKETEKVEWMKISDFYLRYETEYKWAFNHNKTIKEALKHFNKGVL